MEAWEEEYHQRLRRVSGIEDDSIPVSVEVGQTEGYWTGGCETCSYFMEGEPFIKIIADFPSTYYSYYEGREVDTISQEVVKEYSDMGELIRDLAAVEL